MARTFEEIQNAFIAGEIKTQHLETRVFTDVYDSDPARVADACDAAARIRCANLESQTGVSLSKIKESRIDNSTRTPDGRILAGIEGKIGACLVPMGVAGPIRINGQYVQDEVYIPLATNEAALVAGFGEVSL